MWGKVTSRWKNANLYVFIVDLLEIPSFQQTICNSLCLDFSVVMNTKFDFIIDIMPEIRPKPVSFFLYRFQHSQV